MSATLEIDDIVVPQETILGFDQEYEDIEASDWRRTADGGGVLRVSWTGKVRTVISGNGWAASLFAGLQQGVAHTLKCGTPRPVDSATATITLPAARRSDSGYEPVGYALLANDRLVETEITGIVSNVATLTEVDDAVGYRVDYWPQLVVHILRNTCKYASRSNDWAFEIEAEEF